MKEFFEERRLKGSISITIGNRNWSERKSILCNKIVNVIDQFTNLGYTLTLRQLYYQLVAADIIPNHDKVYKKIGWVLDDLRYSGIIDWNAIEDRGRVPKIPYSVEGVADAINDTISQYRLDRQFGQPYHIEVWTEKDAVSGILYRVTSKYQIRLVVNKGYSSSTAMYRAYRRFMKRINQGQPVVVLYLGDHDPSGLDMVRDIEDRVKNFIVKGERLDWSQINDWWNDHQLTLDDLAEYDEKYIDPVSNLMDGEESESIYNAIQQGQREMYLENNSMFRVVHVGLTMGQINQYNPPPNPAKLSDSRSANYVAEHGAVSWELDALNPSDMEKIIESNILEFLDYDQFELMVEQEKEDKIELKKIANKFDD